MKTENNNRTFYLFFLIIAISLVVFTSPLFAQSIFSGLILSEKNDGLKVIDVQKGSPGFDAGLKTGDVLLEIDGNKIKSLEDYIKISRETKNKKVEASLTVLREGVRYDAVLKVYSVPIYQHWNEKVIRPIELPRGTTNSPYAYWVGKGNRTLKKSESQETFETKVVNYNKAIKDLYNGLHHQPESIDTALQIAKSYQGLGSLYLNNGIIKEGIKNYKYSIRLYTNCLKKTRKDDYLKLILANLQEIEKGLSNIDTNKTKSSSETKTQQMRMRIPTSYLTNKTRNLL